MNTENLARKLGMEQKTYCSADGGTLNYCIRKTGDLQSREKAAVMMFLHGAGERGDDNHRQLVHCASDLVEFCETEHRKAILLFPQCPENLMWIHALWSLPEHTMSQEPTPQLKHAIELLENTVKQENGDEKRIYIGGISMGAFGTWDALLRRPDLFTAAIAICGGGDVKQASKLVNIPLRVFHGEVDSAVMVKRSRDMVAAIRAAGGTKVTYTEYPGVDHNSWTQTYADHENLRWLFSQTRSQMPEVSPSITGNGGILRG